MRSNVRIRIKGYVKNKYFTLKEKLTDAVSSKPSKRKLLKIALVAGLSVAVIVTCHEPTKKVVIFSFNRLKCKLYSLVPSKSEIIEPPKMGKKAKLLGALSALLVITVSIVSIVSNSKSNQTNTSAQVIEKFGSDSNATDFSQLIEAVGYFFYLCCLSQLWTPIKFF